MKEIAKKWMDAALIFENNHDSVIVCPECGIGTLYIKDEPIPNVANRIDRYIICNYCGKWNVITLKNLCRVRVSRSPAMRAGEDSGASRVGDK